MFAIGGEFEASADVFPLQLGVAVDPDDVLAIRRPRLAFSWCCLLCGLPTLGPDGLACHDLTTVPRRIKARQSLFQTEWGINHRPDDHPPIFHRDTNLLVDMQMRRKGDRRRQANTQTIPHCLILRITSVMAHS
jgi:hypothetical protein